jgi:acetyl-CoA acetyltransferase
MWSRTDLRPADVDVAQLYDGFSWLTMSWLEALGFCGHGESGPFIEDGTRIALDGEIPLNTNGGQLSGGRLHGYGYLHEAVLQLRGEAGARQVAGGPEVAVVSNGGGPISGCVLLTRLA